MTRNANQKQAGNRPKVVRILGRLTGGPARQASLLHNKLAEHFETRLITGKLCAGESEMSHLLESQSNVFRLSEMSREISPWYDVRALWKIVRFLKKERPDVVHTHAAKSGALGRLAAWIAGVPVIVHTYHGHIFHGYFSPAKTHMYLAIERLLGLVTTRVVVISESQKKEITSTYRVVPEEKVSVVRNGFELGKFDGRGREEARNQFGFGRDRFVIIWAARMAPVKDVELLAQVVRAQAKAKTRACFLVVGEGEEKCKLEELVLGCDNVRVVGWQDEMEKVWSAGDAGLLTSRNEGTPTALIEAMASGLPFVSTNVGGVRDLAAGPVQELSDNMGIQAANGFLTPRKGEALSYCVSWLIDHPEQAAAMGVAGRAFVAENYQSERLIAELNQLYMSLIQQQRRHRRAALEVKGTT